MKRTARKLQDARIPLRKDWIFSNLRVEFITYYPGLLPKRCQELHLFGRSCSDTMGWITDGSL